MMSCPHVPFQGTTFPCHHQGRRRPCSHDPNDTHATGSIRQAVSVYAPLTWSGYANVAHRCHYSQPHRPTADSSWATKTPVSWHACTQSSMETVSSGHFCVVLTHYVSMVLCLATSLFHYSHIPLSYFHPTTQSCMSGWPVQTLLTVLVPLF